MQGHEAGWVFFGVGVFVLLGGVWLGYDSVRFLTNAFSATGKVIDNKRGRPSRKHQTYHPIVEFTDHENQTHTVTMEVGQYPAYSTGTEVPVLYLADQPGRARIHSFAHLWLFPLVLVLVGLFLLGFGQLLVTAKN